MLKTDILQEYGSGIVLVVVLGFFAVLLQASPMLAPFHLSTVIIAILLGMLVKNSLGVKRIMEPGIKFCAKKILRFSIILLGFKLSFVEVAKLGVQGVLLLGVIVFATFFFTRWVGQRLELSKNLSTLIASGCSICGAAAVIAVSALKEKESEEDVTFAIGVVTIFGTIFMFLYPFLYGVLGLCTSDYAFWVGGSVHEVAQVVAAGFSVSNEAGVMGTLIKLTRVLYLIPLTLVMSLLYAQRNGKKFDVRDIQVPYFVIFFIVAIVINSFFTIPKPVLELINQLGLYLMTGAMAALGLETSFKNMKKAGLKPVYLGIAASGFISVLTLVLLFLTKHCFV